MYTLLLFALGAIVLFGAGFFLSTFKAAAEVDAASSAWGAEVAHWRDRALAAEQRLAARIGDADAKVVAAYDALKAKV